MPTKPQKNNMNVFPSRQGLPPPRLEALPAVYFFAPDVERELTRLEHVSSVKVMSTGTEIDEIHVVAPRNHPPKKIVRDIESILLVRFGIRIDHRRISVVQLDGVQAQYPQYGRPRIQKLSKKDGVLQIVLAVGDNILVGKASLPNEGDELRAAARAVIHAVEQLLQTPGVLAVLETQIVEMNEHKVMLVIVRWAFGEQHELLVGASLAAGDLSESMARATLDAVNRRLVRFQTAVAI